MGNEADKPIEGTPLRGGQGDKDQEQDHGTTGRPSYQPPPRTGEEIQKIVRRRDEGTRPLDPGKVESN